MTTWLKDDNGNKCSVATAELLRTQTLLLGDNCINWQGYMDKKGYGRVWFGGAWVLSHRASYLMNIGEIPVGICVRHSCDNPSCVNPKHLLLGTQLQNIRDRNIKNRTARGENCGRAKLTNAKVLEIRKSSESTRKLGKKYGVASSVISGIKNYKYWTHISEGVAI